MVIAGAISPLFDGYSIASVNIVFDKGREAGGGGGGGVLVRSAILDTKVFLKDVVQPLTLVEHKVTLSKAFR